MMEEVVAWLTDALKWVVAIGGAIFAIRGWVIKPITQMRESQDRVNKEMREAIKENYGALAEIKHDLAIMQDDVADTLCDRLKLAHRELMERGWATFSEKMYVCDLYKRYHSRGHNHLASDYEKDILDLPEPSDSK